MKKRQSKLPAWAVKTAVALGYTAWVAGVFIAAQNVIGLLFVGAVNLGIPLGGVSRVILVTLLSVLAYGLAAWAVTWVPWKILHQVTTKKQLGITRLPSWMDLTLGPVAFLPYIILSGLLVKIMSALLPSADMAQKQELGFSTHIFGGELAIAFFLFVIIAPVLEETLFRGYLYGKLRSQVAILPSILLVSLCFGALHGQFNVAIDTFALSVVLCLLREYTGSIWAGVLLHAVKNGLAFYLLFINPSLLSTIGG